MNKYLENLNDIYLQMYNIYQQMLVNYRKIIKNKNTSISKNQLIEIQKYMKKEIPEQTTQFVEYIINRTRIDYENESVSQILYDIYTTQAEMVLFSKFVNNQELDSEIERVNNKMAQLTALYEYNALEAAKTIKN